MDSIDVLREVAASRDGFDLEPARSRLDTELRDATPKRSHAFTWRRPAIAGAGALLAVAAAAGVIALVAVNTAPPDMPVADGESGGPLLTEAPDLLPVDGEVLSITRTTSELFYLDAATGEVDVPRGTDRTNAAGALGLETVDRAYVPGDPHADAVLQRESGGSGSSYVTGTYGDEAAVTAAWTNERVPELATEPVTDTLSYPPGEREKFGGILAPTTTLFETDLATGPRSEAEWVDHWASVGDAVGGDAAPMAVLHAMSDSGLVLAPPQTRVDVVNSLTQVPGVTVSQDGSTAVLEASGTWQKFFGEDYPDPATMRVTVDLELAIVTDWELFWPSPDSGIVPADVADVHRQIVIDRAATMPEG